MQSHPHHPQPSRAPSMSRNGMCASGNSADDGFVEFDFSIGDPALSVELVMPLARV